MITHSAVQSSTRTLFTLLAMINLLAVQSSTWTLFTLLAMITHSAVQSSTRTLFTLLAMIAQSLRCPIFCTDTVDYAILLIVTSTTINTRSSFPNLTEKPYLAIIASNVKNLNLATDISLYVKGTIEELKDLKGSNLKLLVISPEHKSLFSNGLSAGK